MRTVVARSQLHFVLGALLAGCAAPDAVQHVPGPVALYRMNRPGGWWFASRVVDAMTGSPIPGAKVYLVGEEDRPQGGEFWFEREWRADADGFVRARCEGDGGSWFFVVADGYATTAFDSPTGDRDLMLALMPGIDVPIEVRDQLDRPRAGVDVGLCLGCGHTPDVQVVTTDRDGRAVFRGIEPTGLFDGLNIHDVYPRGAGLSPSYDDLYWRLGDPPAIVRAETTHFVSGRILAADGQPMPGIAIQSDFGLHRGPWATTDAEGRFAAFPCDSALLLHVDEREFSVRRPAVADSIDITLPAAPMPEVLPHTAVTVTVRSAADGAAVTGAEVHPWHVGIVGKDRAESVTATTDDEGKCTLEVVTGALGLTIQPPAGEQGAPVFEAVQRDLPAPTGEAQALTIDLPTRPMLRLRVADGVAAVALRVAQQEWSLEIEPDAEMTVPVPAAEPFLLVTSDADGHERSSPFATPPTGVVTLEAPAPTRLTMRAVDASGEGRAADVFLFDQTGGDPEIEPPLQQTDERGHGTLLTSRTGCSLLTLAAREPGYRPRTVLVGLPRLGDDRSLALGDIVLPAADAPLLRVLRANGSAAKGEVRLMRPGLRIDGELADDGGWDGLTPQTGDRVRVLIEQHDGEDGDDRPDAWSVHPELEATLTGAGPWVLHEGTCQLRLRVVDDHGCWPQQGTVFYGDQSFGVKHELELRGLPTGDCELFVGAEHCDSAKVRVHLEPGETRTVDVTLRRAP